MVPLTVMANYLEMYNTHHLGVRLNLCYLLDLIWESLVSYSNSILYIEALFCIFNHYIPNVPDHKNHLIVH